MAIQSDIASQIDNVWNTKKQYEFSQIFRIITSTENRKKRNLQNLPLLVQYGG